MRKTLWLWLALLVASLALVAAAVALSHGKSFRDHAGKHDS